MVLCLAVQRRQDEGAGGGNPIKQVPPLDSTNRILKEKLSTEDYEKLMALNNSEANKKIADAIALCKPSRVFICDDSEKDAKLIAEQAILNREEFPLFKPGHTIHFDGPEDQGRCVDDTFLLVGKEGGIPGLNCKGREEGLSEMNSLMDGIMENGTTKMYVKFHTLGIGEYAIPCLEMTDSAYVAHSANLLYRGGYKALMSAGEGAKFFTFLHSAGELDEKNTSKNIGKRRIMIDLEGETVYSVNTQYAGNTLGMKKLALRLAISKANRDISEGKMWLCEHMYIGGISGHGERMAYFAGDYPSGCGKTSTAMLEKIFGDDIAIIFQREGGLCAVNYEDGMFGIIKDVNAQDDRALFLGMTRSKEVIYSNALAYAEDSAKAQDDSDFVKCVDPKEIWEHWAGKRNSSLRSPKVRVHWTGKRAYNMDEKIPNVGINHEGRWWLGKQKAVDKEGRPIYWGPEKTGLGDGETLLLSKEGKPVLCEHSHKNARFTLQLHELPNVDSRLDDPNGVPISAIVSGGRNPNGMPPIIRAKRWKDGLFFFYGCLESLQTSAASRKGVSEGKPNFDPGSIKDFLPISIGKHLHNNLKFYSSLAEKPGFYATNYFLEDEHGKWLNPEKNDKKVWFAWAEKMEHHEVRARETPLGYIPLYEDLSRLFLENFAPKGEDHRLVELVEAQRGEEKVFSESELAPVQGLRRVNPDLNPKTDGSYSIEEYNAQFTIRVPEMLDKIERMVGPDGRYVAEIKDAPEELYGRLSALRERLLEAQKQFGDYITPDKFPIIEKPQLHAD